jgi:hypothetical protein
VFHRWDLLDGWVGHEVLKTRISINDKYNIKMYIIVKIWSAEKKKLCFSIMGLQFSDKMTGKMQAAKG